MTVLTITKEALRLITVRLLSRMSEIDMSKFEIFFVVPLAAISLAGCSSVNQGPEGGHSVSWYLRHQSKMSKEVAWCKNRARRSSLDSCENAQAASAEALPYNAKRTLHSIGKALS
ncbi:EexN family lipoprotein (plasmid) [Acidithiobacillus caldus]|uniref:EexN family lipoprotein n=2 Tax=Acidithiobacillus caldus TaxID=33059 RepID=UPI00122D47B9|nr:EexN family lipoprotein [Acidithiobacillus caldus]QEM40788.1 EexN family lipoprotein [Acidithiobacillus caldus]